MCKTLKVRETIIIQVRNLNENKGGYKRKRTRSLNAQERQKTGQMADYALAFVVTKCSLCTHQNAHEQMAH